MQQLPAQAPYSRCLTGCGLQNVPFSESTCSRRSEQRVPNQSWTLVSRRRARCHCGVAKCFIGIGNQLAYMVVQSDQDLSMEVCGRGLNKEPKAVKRRQGRYGFSHKSGNCWGGGKEQRGRVRWHSDGSCHASGCCSEAASLLLRRTLHKTHAWLQA